ncbi:MAG: bifunctional (p)ppGpp synthetase/guanosine-3',5'-bis(diphosphate) 3'-pyrophosphohydrolase [Rhodobacteraceae bacterium]|nr:bifunctional (p)ppGpp synthetase/guanosine-3',5'-bis(diphosphate) 3'-pyrophosphohydrolase [Paracoccaceae bacterium]
MIHPTDLIEAVRAYNPNSDSERIEAAWDYGRLMHEGQCRQSGDPYWTHPVAVAMILAEQKLDDDTIITALLHDTIEDTKSTFQAVARRFGPEVAQLVDGVTKLTNLELSATGDKQAANFRKLLLAMSKDVRVIMVKLSDRLHNMRTIRHMLPRKQEKKAIETMEIFAPLAGRMGMQWMREELEDLSFSVINPEARKSIMRRFVTLKKETGDLIPAITQDIREVLDKAGVKAEVTGREKRPYSIWRKMEEKKKGFSRLSDIYGFRIITDTEADCYTALGTVHQHWCAVPGRFKDYISQPKSNGYRSIHTDVSGRNGKRVEIQIRTRTMHDVAESGVAAHWSYRDGEPLQNPFAVDPFRWVDELNAHMMTNDAGEEFLEHVKLDMFSDQVFCFTPKGEVIKLPRGATPIDFAYAIHTRVGSACVGTMVDGRRVPLWTRLRNGQSVEIVTAKGQRPQSSWMDIAVTGRAKSAIRKSLREEHRAGFVRLGRELARVALEKVGKTSSEKALKTAAGLMGMRSTEELLAKIGSADTTGAELVEVLYPELLRTDDIGVGVEEPVAPIIGLAADQLARPGHCCQPLPGERIVGIITRSHGVIVHSIDCEHLADFETEPERWIDLHWTEGQRIADQNATIEVTIANDTGVLGRICTLIGEQKANISNLEFVDRKPDFYRMVIDIEVRDVEHLLHVLTAVEADSDVAQIMRKNRGDRIE